MEENLNEFERSSWYYNVSYYKDNELAKFAKLSEYSKFSTSLYWQGLGQPVSFEMPSIPMFEILLFRLLYSLCGRQN